VPTLLTEYSGALNISSEYKNLKNEKIKINKSFFVIYCPLDKKNGDVNHSLPTKNCEPTVANTDADKPCVQGTLILGKVHQN